MRKEYPQIIAIFLGLVIFVGVGYAGWRHFFVTFSEEELLSFKPLRVEAIGNKSCVLPKPMFSQFSFYRPRYFVIATEEDWKRLAEKLGYAYVNLMNENIDLKTKLIVGELLPLKHEKSGEIIFTDTFQKNNKIVVGVRSVTEDRLRTPEESSLPFGRCVYNLATINKDNMVVGENLIFFLDEKGRILKTDRLLLK